MGYSIAMVVQPPQPLVYAVVPIIQTELWAAGICANSCCWKIFTIWNFLSFLFLSWYNGQFYCNGSSAKTINGLCNGTFYSNGVATYNCNPKVTADTSSCSNFALIYGITVAQLYACNPGLNQIKCSLVLGETYSVWSNACVPFCKNTPPSYI